MTTLIKKSTIAFLSLAMVAVMAAPVMASADNGKNKSENFGNRIASIFNWGKEKNNIESDFLNSASIKSARQVYNQAIKDANTAYNAARKTARDKFTTAFKAAGSDMAKKISAYKQYLTELLAASNQKSASRATAMQNYINAISVTP